MGRSVQLLSDYENCRGSSVGNILRFVALVESGRDYGVEVNNTQLMCVDCHKHTNGSENEIWCAVLIR